MSSRLHARKGCIEVPIGVNAEDTRKMRIREERGTMIGKHVLAVQEAVEIR